MKLGTRTKATVCAVVLALPCVLLAGDMWLKAIDAGPGSYYLYFLRDRIYWLGAPLTLLLPLYTHHVRSLGPEDALLGAYMTGALFVFQWIIWAQLLLIVWRKCFSSKNPGDHPA